jgi:uncharacterized protein YcbK (DUF882 family)
MSENVTIITRRKFNLMASAIAVATLVGGIFRPANSIAFPFLPFADKAAQGVAHAVRKTLTLCNPHNGETCSATFWEDGSYNTEGLQAFNHLMRDRRTGDVKAIDPKLFDILYQISHKLSAEKIEVVCGYRSPKTNAMLHAHSSGVAKNSLHMQGRAIDIRIPGINTEIIRDVAISLKKGGVGYYRASNFVHVDT